MSTSPELTELNFRPNLKNFLDLSQDELTDFAREVAASQGVIEVYIHPFFYSNQVTSQIYGEKYSAGQEVESAITKHLTGNRGQQKRPSLIFEERGLEQTLPAKLAGFQGLLIYLKTKTRQAALDDGHTNQQISLEAILLEKLEQLGVKEILIGGAELKENYKGGRPSLEGCVGEAMGIFGKKFKVTVMDNLTVKKSKPRPHLSYGAE